MTDSDFIEFLHKELVEAMYNREISSDAMTVFHKIISKWRKQNDKEESGGKSL